MLYHARKGAKRYSRPCRRRDHTGRYFALLQRRDTLTEMPRPCCDTCQEKLQSPKVKYAFGTLWRLNDAQQTGIDLTHLRIIHANNKKNQRSWGTILHSSL